jgi:chromosome segregation ATPase
VQYLAEVRKTQAFVGGPKVEIRLLARNTSENNWQAINKEEVILVQDSNQAKDLKDGQLVLADIGGNKNLQNIQDASKRIVLILQNFSRLQDKFRQGEEDIEQWKQSLNYQSQELHRRELELEQREQELEQVDVKKAELEELQQAYEKDKQEYDKQKQLFDAQKAKLEAQAASLSQEQVQQLQGMIRQLAEGMFNPDSIKSQLSSAIDVVYKRQDILTGFWQELDPQKAQAQQAQQALNKTMQDLANRKHQWQQTQVALATHTQAELKAQQGVLKVQENNAAMLRLQLDSQEELYQQTTQVIQSYGGSTELLDPEEAKRLKDMPEDQLKEAVDVWQSEFDKMSNYVSAQEDELASLEGEIADLQSQIDQAGEFDRIELDSNKEFAEEQYRMLEEALVGQRRSLQERQSILTQQREILERRQGKDIPENPSQNLIPLLSQIELQKQRQEKELQKIESQIETVRGIVQQQQEFLARQTNEHQQNYQEIETIEGQIQERIKTTSELWGKVNSIEQILRPVQDIVDALRPQLENAIKQLEKAQSSQEQQQLLGGLQKAIAALMPKNA